MSENQTKIISTRIQHKHDIEANWLKAESFIPLDAELIIYDAEYIGTDLTGTGRTEPITYTRFKVGDGSTPINNLPFTLQNLSTSNITSGVLSIARGGTGHGTLSDSTYTSTRYRGSSLNETETSPTANGTIAWVYE